jgi:hypothetical protein
MVGFLGIEDPKHVAILMEALRGYCRDADIGRECPERGEVARLLVKAFKNGARTPEQLSVAVKADVRLAALKAKMKLSAQPSSPRPRISSAGG